MSYEITLQDLPGHLVRVMEGPTPPADFISNGCTNAPDRVGRADLRAACHWHDYHYSLGCTEDDRRQADFSLYRNLRRCGASHELAAVYFRRVRFHGVNFFSYGEYARPGRYLRRWYYVVNFLVRYLDSVTLRLTYRGVA